jgi:hypothetical protein
MCFHAGLLLGLFFDPADGGYMFLRNVGYLSKECTALQTTRPYSPQMCSYMADQGFLTPLQDDRKPK